MIKAMLLALTGVALFVIGLQTKDKFTSVFSGFASGCNFIVAVALFLNKMGVTW